MAIVDEWLKDLPQQFQAKKNIEVLITAFAKQLQQVLDVQRDLNNLTSIDKAYGKNLDYIGNILSITRKDAQVILKSKEKINIDDETYRKVLKYKALKNTCECSYEDIMESISLLWDTSKVAYTEPPERPATVLMNVGNLDIDEVDPILGKILAIKPSGVHMLYTMEYCSEVDHSILYDLFLKNVMYHAKIYAFPFLVFDGTWLLDGNNLLNAVMKPDELRIEYHYKLGFLKDLLEEAFFKKLNLDNHVRISSNTNRIKLVESYGYVLGQEIGEKATLTTACDIENESSLNVAIVTAKNLWYMDGQKLFDGSKILNASYRKEIVE